MSDADLIRMRDPDKSALSMLKAKRENAELEARVSALEEQNRELTQAVVKLRRWAEATADALDLPGKP